MAQVETNGYFSFDNGFGEYDPYAIVPRNRTLNPDLPFERHPPIVAPYWLDNDLTLGGNATYEVHTSTSRHMEQVSNFISNKENELFSGVWMLVAQWTDIPLFGRDQVKRYIEVFLAPICISECSVLVCREQWMLTIIMLFTTATEK